MRFERVPVIFTDPSNPEFGDAVHTTAIVIDGEYTLEIDGDHEWSFRKVTGRSLKGKPVVELDECERFSLCMEVHGDVEEMLEMTLMEIVRKYAK